MKKNSVLKIEMGNILIRVIMKGFFHGEWQSSSLMHNHAFFEFHILMHGNAILETEQDTIYLKEKDSVLIPSEVFHRFKINEKGAAVLSFSFFIEKNRRKKGADYEKVVRERLSEKKHQIVFSQNLQIEECLNKIISNVYTESLVSEERTKAYFVLLFSEIFSLLDDQSDYIYEYENTLAENDMRIFMIEEYFNEYYMENITLKDLSECLYLSEKQTNKIIKKAFGESFKRRLCRMRLNIAKKLLTDTDMQVREIAEKVGYQSYNGFYIAFKENLKTTPQKYREKTVNIKKHTAY